MREAEGENMNITDTITTLADAYVADIGPGYVMTSLIRIAEQHGPSPLSITAMQLSLANESLVDDLLCRVHRFGQAADGHDLCCEGECDCAGPTGSFVHPMCERCEQAPADRRDLAAQDLAALIHPRMVEYINTLLSKGKAA